FCHLCRCPSKNARHSQDRKQGSLAACKRIINQSPVLGDFFYILVISLPKKPMQAKYPSDSVCIMTDLVLPGETNPLNNLFGGELLARMDRAASIAARRHSRRITVTASVNHVAFNRAIPLGSVVTVEAKVSRTFRSSMEIFIDVW